jgi:broad specificity phosphatase PhoE
MQAQALASYLKGENITPAAIYAGHLKRQVESAQIIAQALCLEGRVHLHEPSLTEIDYGLWEGLTAEAIAARWPAEYADWTEQSKWPHEIFGGTLEVHLKEIDRWLFELRSSHVSGETVLALTSNGIARFFYSYAAREWAHLQQARQMESLKVKTGHFCELLLLPNELQVKRWNVDPSAIVVSS